MTERCGTDYNYIGNRTISSVTVLETGNHINKLAANNDESVEGGGALDAEGKRNFEIGLLKDSGQETSLER